MFTFNLLFVCFLFGAILCINALCNGRQLAVATSRMFYIECKCDKMKHWQKKGCMYVNEAASAPQMLLDITYYDSERRTLLAPSGAIRRKYLSFSLAFAQLLNRKASRTQILSINPHRKAISFCLAFA